jgi:hypothetical protein
MPSERTLATPGGCDPVERLRELRCTRMRDPRQRGVVEDAELMLDGGDQPRVTVAERRGPPRGVRVDVAPTVGVDDPRALRLHDDDRIDLGAVPTHFRVGMPDTALVEFYDSRAIVGRHGTRLRLRRSAYPIRIAP